jgi:hypothetical protein
VSYVHYFHSFDPPFMDSGEVVYTCRDCGLVADFRPNAPRSEVTKAYTSCETRRKAGVEEWARGLRGLFPVAIDDRRRK